MLALNSGGQAGLAEGKSASDGTWRYLIVLRLARASTIRPAAAALP